MPDNTNGPYERPTWAQSRIPIAVMTAGIAVTLFEKGSADRVIVAAMRPVGIQLDATSASNTLTTIVNNVGGVVQGTAGALVAKGNASVDFTNRGAVVGDLVFGAGAAALHFYTGTTLTGSLTAGTGADTISFNGSRSGAFSNPISNFQTITKQDDGTWTLSGAVSGATVVNVTQGTLILSAANTYTGATDVQAGTLAVTGSTVSVTTVESGATNCGSGAIGSLNAMSGARVAPGVLTPYSALTVNGTASFASGSTFAVNINAAGQNDKLAVNGATTIAGGAVQVSAASGVYAPSMRYTLITATGGVSESVGNFV
jgi:autotransporter-associated beta strand protein